MAFTNRYASDIFQVDNLGDFDHTQGKGKNKLDYHEIRGLKKDGGFSKKEIYDYAQGLKESGTKIGKKSQALLDKYLKSFSDGGDGETPDLPPPNDGPNVPPPPEDGGDNNPPPNDGGGNNPPSDIGKPTPLYGNQDITSGSTSFNTNQQNDNRITFGDVKGENNTVNPFVDNSVTNNYTDNSDNSRYYGGSSRYFNYKGGDGESRLYDSPVSMATMGGYYDVDDSPAANAKFLDMYMDSNNLYQRANDKHYRKTGTFDYESDRTRAFDPYRMMERIDEAPGRSYARSDKEMANLYGDVWGKAPPKWEMPAEPVKDDVDLEDVAEDYEDEID